MCEIFAIISLTYDTVAGATGLRSATINIKIGVSARAPLTQYACCRMYDVHEMSVRGIKVPGSVVAHVEYDRWVQAGDSADFSRVDEVRRQPCDVSAHAIPVIYIYIFLSSLHIASNSIQWTYKGRFTYF